MKKLLNIVPVALLAVIAFYSTGCAYYSGVLEVSGKIVLADGVTPLPTTADVQISALYTTNSGSNWGDSVETSNGFSTDPNGEYFTTVNFNEESDGKIISLQLKATGSLGIVIESRLIAYSADYRVSIEKQILASCQLRFESRNYPVADVELAKRSTNSTPIAQDFVVNVTAEQLAQYTDCQNRIFNLATVNGAQAQ